MTGEKRQKAVVQPGEVWLCRAAWIVLALAVLFVVVVRLRLREMPLERDEGEYAYAGQLMLEGIPPYQLAYNMKLPGTYAAYAVIMAAFGQTPAGIHLGVAVVNIATIVMMFFLGRGLLDAVTGAVAALAYALLSTSPALIGTAGHATHFVVLFAVAGLLLLQRACETNQRIPFFLCGLLFGLAFLMKQPGITFGLFALVYVVWRNCDAGRLKLAAMAAQAGALGLGMALPYGLTCLWLWRAGVFREFCFWTVGYAREYLSTLPFSLLTARLRQAGEYTILPTTGFWVLGAAGVVMMWWERRLKGRQWFLLGFVIAAAMATGAGLYLREHYFITFAPALALLAGVVVSRSVDQLRRERSVELFSALGVLLLFAFTIVATFVGHGEMWFGTSPGEASRTIYGSTIFTESPAVADYLRMNSPPTARVAVIGSEPQLYFYSGRHSATGYIYTYGLMGHHPLARRMQEEMIREIETVGPDWIVYVDDRYSWLESPGSDRRIFEWWEGYWNAHYDLVRVIKIAGRKVPVPGQLTGDETAPTTGSFMILKRKPGAG